jgi:hypothetical protein
MVGTVSRAPAVMVRIVVVRVLSTSGCKQFKGGPEKNLTCDSLYVRITIQYHLFTLSFMSDTRNTVGNSD